MTHKHTHTHTHTEGCKLRGEVEKEAILGSVMLVSSRAECRHMSQ